MQARLRAANPEAGPVRPEASPSRVFRPEAGPPEIRGSEAGLSPGGNGDNAGWDAAAEKRDGTDKIVDTTPDATPASWDDSSGSDQGAPDDVEEGAPDEEEGGVAGAAPEVLIHTPQTWTFSQLLPP